MTIINNAKSCVVIEEANSIFKLELEYPIINGDNKLQYLIKGNIIKASTPKSSGQLFRIVHIKKDLKTMVITANHIFYDLLGYFIEDARPTLQSGVLAFPYILNNTVDKHRFNGFSDIESVNTAFYVRKNVVESLISNLDQSFVNRWGGELDRDNYTIKILQNAGQDRGYKVTYGKNLKGFEETLDLSGVITKIMPTGLNENDTTLMLPEKYILSPHINDYPHPYTQEFHYTDLRVNEESGITKELVYKDLRDKVKELYEVQEIDLPRYNWKVDFVELSKTEEYKDFKALTQIYLWDTIFVKSKDKTFKAKMIKYEWDSISNKYLNIELGEMLDDMTSNFTKINTTLGEMSEIIIRDKTDLDKAIDHATNLMNNALGGYVLKRNSEILIMDTEDPNTCKQCWKWNINGLGYSSTGYGGRYELAMTMDGRINANFITTGVLNASIVQTGALTSKDGSVNINLDNGSFRIGGNGAVAEHTPLGSKYLHWNGGYTQVTNGGLKIETSQGRTAFSVDNSGYILNEWGVKTMVKPGGTISVQGNMMADDQCSTLLRAFGLWHESIDGKYNMRIGSKSEIWFKNLADDWQDTRARWMMANQFRTTYDNNTGVILRENCVDSGTGRLYLNWGGGTHGNISKTLICDGMSDGSYGEFHCGSLYTHGSKNRAVETEHFGTRALGAYETPTPYFGDISRDICEVIDGQCIVPIEPIFRETITSTGKYQVFLSKYGPGDIWTEEMHPTYFIVKGANIKFSWELKAIQRGYENNRLEQVEI